MSDLNNNEPLNKSISVVVNYADASLNVMSLVWLRSVLTCIVYNFTFNKIKSAWKPSKLSTKTACLGLYCINYLKRNTSEIFFLWFMIMHQFHIYGYTKSHSHDEVTKLKVWNKNSSWNWEQLWYLPALSERSHGCLCEVGF